MHQLKKSYHRKSNSGFTLAETLVAIFVLSTVLAMSAGLLMKSYYASEQSRDLTSATLIARSQLERISETPFNELIGTEVPRNGKIEQGSKTYHWNLEVDDVEGEENLARLKIVVSWNARRGISQQEFSCLRRK